MKSSTLNMSNTENNFHNSNGNSLKIMAINVNSIISNDRRYSLALTLSNLKPDIVLISKTKLNKRNQLSSKDYKVLRNDRDSDNGGGTAILIKNNISFTKVEINSKLKILEVSVIQIKLQNNQKLFIISAYTPKECNRNFIEDLDLVFNNLKFQDTNNWYVMTGDMNARHPLWLDSTNHRGSYLVNWMEEKEFLYRTCLYGPERPTFPRSGAFLDIAICDSRLEIMDLREEKLRVFPYDSDHRSITFRIEFPNDIRIISEKRKELDFNCYKADWDEFKEFLKINSVPLPHDKNLLNNEIDIYIDEFNSLIKQAIEHAVPRYKQVDFFKKFLTPQICKLKK